MSDVKSSTYKSVNPKTDRTKKAQQSTTQSRKEENVNQLFWDSNKNQINKSTLQGDDMDEQSQEGGQSTKPISLFQSQLMQDYNKERLGQLLKRNIAEKIKEKINNTKKRKKKLVYRYNRDEYQDLKKFEQEIEKNWQQKIDLIKINHSKAIDSILDCTEFNDQFEKDYKKFNDSDYTDEKLVNGSQNDSFFESQNKQIFGSQSAKDDDSEVSEINEKDLTLLFCGDHQNYFEAKEVFEEIRQKDIETKKKLQTDKYCFCIYRKKKQKQQDSDIILNKLQNEIKTIVDHQAEVKKSKMIVPVGSVEHSNQGMMQKMVTVLNLDQGSFLKDNIPNSSTAVFVENGERRHRSGKELWAIARSLTYDRLKQQNFTRTMMNAVRAEKIRKQREQQEKKEQFQKELLLQQQQQAQEDTNQLTDDMSCLEKIEYNIFKYYTNLLVYPDNKKLKYFHLIVAITLFFDFYITGLILGNYLFITGKQDDFIDHKRNYIFICIIQGLDIILNFIKSDYKMKSKVIFINYLKGNFLTDLIAVIPYSLFMRPLIILRYLKLLKYNIYLTYFEDFMIDLCKFMNYKQLQIFKSMFRLIFQLSMVSHLFASFWCLIGNYLLQNQQGWIYNNNQGGIQKLDFSSIYITSIYWVITTFTSIGYGDVYGHSIIEYMYIILVEMVGMCFFGYMMGTFQQLIQDLATDEQFVVEQDRLDQWLISLNKVVKNNTLSPIIFKGVQEFFDHRFKNNPNIIMDNQLFHQMKPRLRRIILDFVFCTYYKRFETIFEGCEINFQREVFMNSEYMFYHEENDDDDDDYSNSNNSKYSPDPLENNNKRYDCGHTYLEHVWYDQPKKPTILEAGKKSNKIYLILSGPIYIMDPMCQFEYGVLYTGSYMGEISLFFDEPNQFCYAYNPYQKFPPIQCLSIDSEVFMRICRKYPVSFEKLLLRAYKRKKIFENYRTICLLTLMKGILRFNGLFQKLAQEKTIAERLRFAECYNIRKSLYQSIYSMFQMNLNAQKQKYIENKLMIKKQRTSELQFRRKSSISKAPEDDLCKNSSDDQNDNQQIKSTLQNSVREQRRRTVIANHQLSQMQLQSLLNNVQQTDTQKSVEIQKWQNQFGSHLQTITSSDDNSSSNSVSQSPTQRQSQSSGSKSSNSKHNLQERMPQDLKEEDPDISIMNQSQEMLLKNNTRNDAIVIISQNNEHGTINDDSQKTKIEPITDDKIDKDRNSSFSTMDKREERRDSNSVMDKIVPKSDSSANRAFQQEKYGSQQFKTAWQSKNQIRSNSGSKQSQGDQAEKQIILSKDQQIKQRNAIAPIPKIPNLQYMPPKQRGRTPAVSLRRNKATKTTDSDLTQQNSIQNANQTDRSRTQIPIQNINGKYKDYLAKSKRDKHKFVQTSQLEQFYHRKNNSQLQNLNMFNQMFRPSEIMTLMDQTTQATAEIKKNSQRQNGKEDQFEGGSVTSSPEYKEDNISSQNDYLLKDQDFQDEIKAQLKKYFQYESFELLNCNNQDQHQQLHHFNRIIEEFINLKNVMHDQQTGLSAEIYLARYISVINTGKFPKTFIPRPVASVLKSRRRFIQKNGRQGLSFHDIDILNLQKNLEHNILYKQYQDEQLFHVQHTEHNLDQVQLSQSYIQNSLKRQMESNRQFKSLYDTKLDQLKYEIAQWQQNVNNKLELILKKQQDMISKKKAEKEPKNQQNDCLDLDKQLQVEYVDLQ